MLDESPDASASMRARSADLAASVCQVRRASSPSHGMMPLTGVDQIEQLLTQAFVFEWRELECRQQCHGFAVGDREVSLGVGSGAELIEFHLTSIESARAVLDRPISWACWPISRPRMALKPLEVVST